MDKKTFFAILVVLGTALLIFNHAFYNANRKVTVTATEPDLIFQKDGCDGYAFKADGEWQYYVTCPNSKTSTTYGDDKHITSETK